MKKRITEELKKLANEDTINLSSNKRRALFDFVTVLPEIRTKIITRDNIIHWAKENGMIDDNLKSFPDYDKILATCRRNPTDEQYKKIKDTFKQLQIIQ